MCRRSEQSVLVSAEVNTPVNIIDCSDMHANPRGEVMTNDVRYMQLCTEQWCVTFRETHLMAMLALELSPAASQTTTTQDGCGTGWTRQEQVHATG